MLVQECDVKEIDAARSTSQEKQEAVSVSLKSKKQVKGSDSRRPSSLSDVEMQYIPLQVSALRLVFCSELATSVSVHVINVTFLQLFLPVTPTLYWKKSKRLAC